VATGHIWPLVLAHAGVDFLGKLVRGWGHAAGYTPFEVVVYLGGTVLLALYGWWLLTRARAAAPAHARQSGSMDPVAASATPASR
jgi:hypothetical protein